MRASNLAFLLLPTITAACTTNTPGGTPDGGGGDASDAAPTGDGEGGCASAPAWDPNVTRIDNDSPLKNQFAHVGFDAAGNAIVLWEQYDPSTSLTTLWSARRSAAGMFGAPVQVDGTNGMSLPPHSRVAVAAGGSAIAVWEQSAGADAGTYTIPYAAAYNAGMWGAPTALHADVAPSQGSTYLEPHVAIDTKGNAIVAFSFDDGAQPSQPDYAEQIYVARFVAGSWSAPGRLSSNDPFLGAGSHDVAMNETGDAIVVWTQSGRVVVTRVAAGATAPSGQAFVDSATSNFDKLPQVAIDSQGNATVVWLESQGAVNGSRLPPGSLQGMATPFGAMVPNPSAGHPLVAANANGHVTAAWDEVTNDPSSIWANDFAGGSWMGPVAIETAAAEATNPALALDDSGNAMLVWETGAGIKASAMSLATGTWGSPVVLNPQASTSGNADVAFAHGCPRALAVWTQGTGNGSGIYAAIYQ